MSTRDRIARFERAIEVLNVYLKFGTCSVHDEVLSFCQLAVLL